MNCINCGTQLPENSIFCLQCGIKQIEEPVSAGSRPEGLTERRRKGIFFLDNLLAFLAVGVLATITVILFAAGSKGFTVWDVTDIALQFCLVGPLAVSALVSARTGGLDLSMGAMMALSSMIFAMHANGNNAAVGFLIALIVCTSLGFLNGLFIMVSRVPSVLVTVASAMLIRGIAMWAGGGISIELPAEWAKVNTGAAVAALLASVGIAILLLWRTGKFAKNKQDVQGKMQFFWVYGVMAVVGVLAGCAAAICFGTVGGEVGLGSSNEMIPLFIFTTISATGLLKNNWIALAWVLLVALLWTIHDQAMILLELNPFSMIVSNASWVFILLAVMSIAKRSWRKPMWGLLNP